MKLLVIGGKGQLGTELQQHARKLGWEVYAPDRQKLDITDAASVSALIAHFAPDAVVNAAAYTAVDRAESDKDVAFSVNRDGPANIAASCAAFGIPIVHYSTDYVFDGTSKIAYVESDAVAPLGVYGASKLAGEQAVRSACPQHLILRTSWVFSPYGQNFVKTMLRLGCERDVLSIVSDQVGKPTSAGELSRLTLEILPEAGNRWGTYHVAQPCVTSWYAFAEAVFSEASNQGIELCVNEVRPISTAEYPTPAKRPANSELNCDSLEAVFGVSIRLWKDLLAETVHEAVIALRNANTH